MFLHMHEDKVQYILNVPGDFPAAAEAPVVSLLFSETAEE